MPQKGPCNDCKYSVPLDCNDRIKCANKVIKLVIDCLERGIFPEGFDPNLVEECEHHESLN